MIQELKTFDGRIQAIRDRQNNPSTPNYAILERIDLERTLLNAMPGLLDILSQFRKGDSDALAEIANLLEETGFVAKAAYVRRYHDIAKNMETVKHNRPMP
jgi:hypothetical protein